ncbi:PREDICTED: uncharacterized protein LOC106116296 isoform X1 [Papilio xuthus]|uniref:Uncharacterized protein LOC106116296 isoform X1 n=1 Tax=Papilio xuthus TaxID=66420 RepID=A0AAJ7E713_PAPXU|nr:PREDICTED: uncharacterized protein LOC106116296 isoform X1 [Papilio xuthus]
MLDDEHDELPLVSVGSGNYNLSHFSMPPADVLASQRAREQECERELRLLRELHAADNGKCTLEELQSTPSNSSELDELLLVEANDASTRHVSVKMSDFITQLTAHLPEGDSQFLRDYLEVLQHESPDITKLVNKEMLSVIEAGLAGACGWLQGASVCCIVWLCALCLAGEAGLRGRRALHAQLQHATTQQLLEVSHVMCGALQAPHLLLRLSDALRGPGAPARLADHLVHHALTQCESQGSDAGSWRSLTHVQLAGRAAAAGRPAPRLAAPRNRDHKDAIKMAVAVCRLDHLCRNNNNSSGNTAELK